MYYRGTRAASLLISKQNKLSNGQNTHTARIPRAKIVKFEEHSRRSSGNALLVAEFQMFTCKIPAFFVFAHSAAFKSAQSLPSHCDVWVEWSKFKFVFFHRNAQELTHTQILGIFAAAITTFCNVAARSMWALMWCVEGSNINWLFSSDSVIKSSRLRHENNL